MNILPFDPPSTSSDRQKSRPTHPHLLRSRANGPIIPCISYFLLELAAVFAKCILNSIIFLLWQLISLHSDSSSEGKVSLERMKVKMRMICEIFEILTILHRKLEISLENLQLHRKFHTIWRLYSWIGGRAYLNYFSFFRFLLQLWIIFALWTVGILNQLSFTPTNVKEQMKRLLYCQIRFWVFTHCFYIINLNSKSFFFLKN